MRRVLVVLCWGLLVGLPPLGLSSAQGEDWPQFRGPTGQGHTPSKLLPAVWGKQEGAGDKESREQNVRWKAPLHGDGHASPIVLGERVIVCTVEWPADEPDKKVDKKQVMPKHHVTCYHTGDGRELWNTQIEPGPWLRSDFRSGAGGGYASPTPSTDGQRIYVLFGSSVLAALDLEGKLVWRKVIEPHTFDVTIGSSPVLAGGRLIVFCAMAKKSDSRVFAVDPATGETQWETKLPTVGFGHSTPMSIEAKGRKQLLVLASGGGQAADALQALDPATGGKLWWCKGGGDASSPCWSPSAGLVYFDSGRGGPGVAVDPTGEGNVTETHVKWTVPTVPEAIGSPLAVGEYIYRLHTPAVLKCWKAATGEQVYAERIPVSSTWASPVADSANRIFLASAGKSVVIAAGDKYQLLGASDLGDANHCSPAVANERMYLVGTKYVWCVATPE